MNPLTFQPMESAIKQEFGTTGLQLFRSMEVGLKKINETIELIYGEKSKTFVILNNKQADAEAIQCLFKQIVPPNAKAWKPSLDAKRDGTYLVRLVDVSAALEKEKDYLRSAFRNLTP